MQPRSAQADNGNITSSSPWSSEVLGVLRGKLLLYQNEYEVSVSLRPRYHSLRRIAPNRMRCVHFAGGSPAPSPVQAAARGRNRSATTAHSAPQNISSA